MLWWLFCHSLNIFLTSAYIFFYKLSFWPQQGLPRSPGSKESICQCRRHRRLGFDPWVGRTPWHRKWQPSPTFLPGNPYGRRSLVSHSPGRGQKSDTAEQQHMCTHCCVWYMRQVLCTHFSRSSSSPPQRDILDNGSFNCLEHIPERTARPCEDLESVPQGWTEKP